MSDATRVATWAGLQPTGRALQRLERLAEWLEAEALPAGGIGPNEAEHIGRRHVLDSLVFAGAWRDRRQPASLVDLGAGVGLPGLPLAITLPDTRVSLIERSGRRCRLMKRAIRILELENVEVVQGDITRPDRRADAVVSRAALPPERLHPLLAGWLTEGGLAVVAGSTRRALSVDGYETLEIPSTVLDSATWLLIMAKPVKRS